jgi:hypothetical protein
MENNDKKKHITTSTILKVDANAPLYHCGFFCQRRTTSDEVIDPKDTKKKNAQQSKECHK